MDSSFSAVASEGVDFWSHYAKQLKGLLYKNCLLIWRRKTSTGLRIAAPFIFLFLTWIINKAYMANRNSLTFDDPSPTPTDVSSLQDCTNMFFRDQSEDCFTFAYSPSGNDAVEKIVSHMLALNGDEIPSSKVIGFASASDLDDYLLDHPQTVQAAVNFNIESSNIGYAIQTNNTAKFFRGKFEKPIIEIQLPLQHLVEKAIARHVTGMEIDWEYDLIEFPHPTVESDSVVSSFAILFLFAAAMFNFVIQATTLITEKETGVRSTMVTAGMYGSAWWLSWIIAEIMFVVTSAILTSLFGLMFDLDLFTRNSFSLVFLTFLLFGFAISGFGFLFSVLIKRSNDGTTIGFMIFIIGYIIQIVVQFGFPYDDSANYGFYRPIFSLFPPSLLALALNHLGGASDSTEDNKGIKWSERYNYCYDYEDDVYCSKNYCQDDCAFSIADAFVWWIVEFFVLAIFSIYLDYVLGRLENISLSPDFFLYETFWRPRPIDTEEQFPNAICRKDDSQDQDVTEEEDRTRALRGSQDVGKKPVEIYGMEKMYEEFRALQSNWYTIDKDELFCLLGPNGAGKTTTINCLIGNLRPDYGFAVTNGHIAGYVIPDIGSMNALRRSIGVCPQFDSVYPDLTALEHMQLVHLLKHVYGEEATANSLELLADVNLSTVANTRVGAFSGGMRRRLSLAMAMAGNPSILYLDEPTTGMDPISRRNVWDVINKAKTNRAIILTTHSMEEADILGDRIAIMANGRLRCIGSSVYLKSKFGAGYRLSVPTAANSEDMKAFMMKGYSLEPSETGVSHISYAIPRDWKPKIPIILQALSDNNFVDDEADVQIRLTTLEEVFLNIARDAAIEAQGDKQVHVSWDLPDGRELLISLGAKRVSAPPNPNGSFSDAQRGPVIYDVQWTTDDEGNLQILSVQEAQEDH